jgi:hypothetical protein
MKGSHLVALLCLVFGLAALPFYSSHLESRYYTICQNRQKLTVIDAQKLNNFSNFVVHASSHRTEKMWNDELRKAGFAFRDDANMFSFKIGITEYQIHVVAHGKDIAMLENVVLVKPIEIIAVDNVRVDGNCAHRSPEYYPKFWQLLMNS